MCGIAGTFGKQASDKEVLDRTISLMYQRGPDANGIFKATFGENNIQLLHSRLSIIDLDEKANQPFHLDNCALIFNGEIYNYIELKKELISLRCSFYTNSDTEVVANAYCQWGVDCFKRFEGMWSIAIYDKNTGKLVLSRDRFGEKPFYYCVIDGTLYFGSEVKFIASLLDKKKLKLNVDRIRHFLVFGFKTLFKDPCETYFSDIKSIPPASYAELNNVETIHIEKYWSVSYAPRKMTMKDAIEGTKQHLEESLKLRLRSDVPLAFCLSGGIDSSTLVGMAAKKFGYDAHTFSIIDSDQRYDERDNIESTINYLGCKSYFAETSKNGFFERLESLVDYHDSPVTTISYYVHSFLSEEISRRGYKVVLSGTAADEVFTGYYDHYNLWLAEMAEREDYDELLSDWQEGYGQFVRNPILKDPECYIKNPHSREHIYLNHELFNSLLCEPLADCRKDLVYSPTSILRNRMLNELNHEIVPVILKEDDSNSMKWSIENRSPYLDSSLIDFLYSVPNEFLVNDGYLKWLLRSAGEGYYPDSVRLSKEKKGFNASINSLVDFNDREAIDNILSDSLIYDFVDRNKIEKFLKSDMDSNSFSKFMFSFISTKLFIDSKQAQIYIE